jgi:hypothetical protein
VNATRFAKGPTEDAAKAMLSEFTIAESVSPDRVALDGTPKGNLGFGRSQHVDYRITVPRATAVTIRSTNSEIHVTGTAGVLHVESTNGEVTGTALGNGADIRLVNGTIHLDLAKLGDAGVKCKTTNGEIVVTVPADTRGRDRSEPDQRGHSHREAVGRGPRADGPFPHRHNRRRRAGYSARCGKRRDKNCREVTSGSCESAR